MFTCQSNPQPSYNKLSFCGNLQQRSYTEICGVSDQGQGLELMVAKTAVLRMVEKVQ